MPKSVCLSLILSIAVLLLPIHKTQGALPQKVNDQEVPSLAPMLERVSPAVVNIATLSTVTVRNPLLEDPFFRHFFDPPKKNKQRKTESAGSGVIVDAKNGYILTNNHVVNGADEIVITLSDGRSLPAKLIGQDKNVDLAVLQIPSENLTDIHFADSNALRVGDFAVAIGNPFGLGQTVTSGIISALGRTGLGIHEAYENFIQTDASINPGNSGGALVDLKGQLIGINTAIIAPSGGNVGIGFAIPVNMAKKIMGELINHGEVRRGRLGVLVQDLTPELAEAFGVKQDSGVILAEIEAGSVAEKAGLEAGDIIQSFGNERITEAKDLHTKIGFIPVGQDIKLGVIRNSELLHVTIHIQEPKTTLLSGDKLHPQFDGADFSNWENPETGEKGVIISNIDKRSPAFRSGLREKDIIVATQKERIDSIDALSKAIDSKSRSILLRIYRHNKALFLVIR